MVKPRHPISQEPLRIFVLEDNPIMADCFALAAQTCLPTVKIAIQTFPDAITATAELAQHMPDLILLDILLTGPDGFTFLNELISYQDTAAIPVIVISSLDLNVEDLRIYGVHAALRKDTMTPQDLQAAIRDALNLPTPASPGQVSAQKGLTYVK